MPLPKADLKGRCTICGFSPTPSHTPNKCEPCSKIPMKGNGLDPDVLIQRLASVQMRCFDEDPTSQPVRYVVHAGWLRVAGTRGMIYRADKP